MRSFNLSDALFLFVLAVPATVFACEGDCIVGITNAFVGNYTSPVEQVMSTIVRSCERLHKS